LDEIIGEGQHRESGVAAAADTAAQRAMLFVVAPSLIVLGSNSMKSCGGNTMKNRNTSPRYTPEQTREIIVEIMALRMRWLSLVTQLVARQSRPTVRRSRFEAASSGVPRQKTIDGNGAV
jgi:hypothetical protein